MHAARAVMQSDLRLEVRECLEVSIPAVMLLTFEVNIERHVNPLVVVELLKCIEFFI